MLIYNVDETGVTVVTRWTGVITQVGHKAVYSIAAAENRKSILSWHVDQHQAMSYFQWLYFLENVYLINKCPDVFLEHFLHVHQMAGLTKCYMRNGLIFIDNLPPVRPGLLIEDGHSSHISISVIEKAWECNNYILCLPAHTIHLLQPLDVDVFKSFKENFRKACHYLCKGGRVVTDQDIIDLVAEAWPVSMTPVNFMSGFKKVWHLSTQS